MEPSKDKPHKERVAYSLREKIRSVIRLRVATGMPLTYREIQKDAGGGSPKTILDEIRKAPKLADGVLLVGQAANAPSARIRALEEAVLAGQAREAGLRAEKEQLEKLLGQAQTNLDRVLGEHGDSKRVLLRATDELRQMIQAGRANEMLRTVNERANELPQPPAPGLVDGGDVYYWKAKHDQVLRELITSDQKKRQLEGQLSEAGIDV